MVEIVSIPNRFEERIGKSEVKEIANGRLSEVMIDSKDVRFREVLVQNVDGLATMLKPGGKLFLMCFSDEEPGTDGPRRISKTELHESFAEGWDIESIVQKRFGVIPDLKEMTFSEGAPRAWFVVVRRNPD